MPAFIRYRNDYFDDESYRAFQNELLRNPEKGDVIQGTGGLRKVRIADAKRNKGKRGGARVVYYWYVCRSQFLLFTVYGKDMQEDLSADERKLLAAMLKTLKEQYL
nr:toxin [Neisseria lisongii]